ncbi:MAG TPA: LpxD N-terminal domain-containing protein, partial [Acetobacteraceae bacterium]|nr:LpxD N-terminal domain-containing protein [Acetobacteraceae bacterium]
MTKEAFMDGNSIGDARFYARRGPYTLAQIAAAAGGVVSRGDYMMAGVAPLQVAGPDEISFLNSRRYISALAATRAGAVIVHPDMVDDVPASAIPIVTKATYEGWARVMALFHPAAPLNPGIHPTAFVAPDAVVDLTTEIGAFSHIEEGAQIGPRCRIGPYASIGKGVVIGADCR